MSKKSTTSLEEAAAILEGYLQGRLEERGEVLEDSTAFRVAAKGHTLAISGTTEDVETARVALRDILPLGNIWESDGMAIYSVPVPDVDAFVEKFSGMHARAIDELVHRVADILSDGPNATRATLEKLGIEFESGTQEIGGGEETSHRDRLAQEATEGTSRSRGGKVTPIRPGKRGDSE